MNFAKHKILKNNKLGWILPGPFHSKMVMFSLFPTIVYVDATIDTNSELVTQDMIWLKNKVKVHDNFYWFWKRKDPFHLGEFSNLSINGTHRLIDIWLYHKLLQTVKKSSRKTKKIIIRLHSNNLKNVCVHCVPDYGTAKMVSTYFLHDCSVS